MDEFLAQFLIECRELVEQATRDLLALEEQPADSDGIDSVFRAFHTLKGAAGIVDFAAMGRALHAAEDVLSAVRSKDRPVTVELIGDCLTCIDQVEQWLDAMQEGGEAPAGADAQADRIVARFTRAAPENAVVETPAPSAPDTLTDQVRILLQAQLALLGETGTEGLAGRLASATRVAANVLQASGEPDRALQLRAATTADDLIFLLTGFLVGEPQSAERLAPARVQAQDAARVLRVDVDRIDALVKIVGELTIVKNAIGHMADQAPAETRASIKSQHDLLDRLVSELHRSVLSIRVLPLGHVFQRFPRLLREIAAATGKPVRLITEGETTEADKVVVESLFEPLLHLLRNAVDHGVEPAAQRLAAGKPELATITLQGAREGDKVVVKVMDDGGGVDVARVRQVALERGVVTAEALQAMADEAVLDLIFAPGFSTAAVVSDLSGRGVGMDAVRTAVERLGGRVTIASEPSAGTTVRFLLPFSVMISRVMTVQAGDQMFGIPLDAVVETVRVSEGAIMPVGAARALVLRNRTIPVINLAEALGRQKTQAEDGGANIIIASIGGQLGGLEVDRLGERMDVMLKPMDGLLSRMPGMAGTTVLGDGRVLIVLDLNELLQ